MRYMQPGAGEFTKCYVPKNHDGFSGIGNSRKAHSGGNGPLVHGAAMRQFHILAMGYDRKAQAVGIFHCPSHHKAVHHRLAIVCYCYRPCVFQLAEFTQGLAFKRFADGADRIDPNAAGFCCSG